MYVRVRTGVLHGRESTREGVFFCARNFKTTCDERRARPLGRCTWRVNAERTTERRCAVFVRCAQCWRVVRDAWTRTVLVCFAADTSNRSNKQTACELATLTSTLLRLCKYLNKKLTEGVIRGDAAVAAVSVLSAQLSCKPQTKNETKPKTKRV